MELEYELNNNTEKKTVSLKDGIFKSKISEFTFFGGKNSSTKSKKSDSNCPSYRIISSLFTQNFKETFCESNDKMNKRVSSNNKEEKENNDKKRIINISNNSANKFLINYNIYNIKGNSIFHIKIFDKYIKYFPIFKELSEYERYINYNPSIEKNPNFEIILPNITHINFCVSNYEISSDKFQQIKEKYIKHNFTKNNITHLEEIFKYLFEEIKFNISCIDVDKPYEEILKYCSKLINDINEIVEDIINDNNKIKNDLKIAQTPNKDIINGNNSNFNNINNNFQITYEKERFCLFNNNLIRKNFTLNCMNSKSIEYNFLESDKKNENNNINNDFYKCQHCSKIFSSNCELKGHINENHFESNK